MYRAQDLATEAEVSVNTIYQWVKRGILPPAVYPPHCRKRALAFYTPDHMKMVRAIKRHHDERVTLVELRERIFPVEDDE